MKFEVFYKKTFLKELKKLPRDIRERVESLAFDILPAVEDITEVKGLEKLVGYDKSYKVRFGDYRAGIEVDAENKVIVLCRVLHRKEIYRYYP